MFPAKKRQKTKGKKKKFKVGKIKRHKLKKAVFQDNGFGKTITTPFSTFRVEMNWLEQNGDENEFEIHWINCRKFIGEERKNLLLHYKISSDGWTEKETLESKFVCVYVSKFLAENGQSRHLNQAFIFPSTTEGNETIREPIYIVRFSQDLSKELTNNIGLDLVLKNSIDHRFEGKIVKMYQ